jgi:hypothetical protein
MGKRKVEDTTERTPGSCRMVGLHEDVASVSSMYQFPTNRRGKEERLDRHGKESVQVHTFHSS